MRWPGRRFRIVADVLEGVLVDARVEEEDCEGEWHTTAEVVCERTVDDALRSLSALPWAAP